MTDDTPKTPRKRNHTTAAITFRLPKWWVKKLDRIAREFSLKYQENIGRTDLVRDAIEAAYIEGKKRTLTHREYAEKRSMDLIKSFRNP